MYLDNLYKQLINKKLMGKRGVDDVDAIAKMLKRELEEFTKDVRQNVCGDGEDDFMFEGMPVKSEYKMDYKVKRAIENFATLRSLIQSELETIQPVKKVIQEYEPSERKFEEENDGELLLLEKKRSRSTNNRESLSKIGVMNAFDYDLEIAKEENEFLTKASQLTSQLNEMNQDINSELFQQREKLLEADKVAAKAVVESEQALEEVKTKAKGKWTWFPWKFAFFSGAGGAVTGGVAATIPGAVVGAVGGAVGGAIIGKKIKKEVHSSVDKVEGEKPEFFDKSVFDEDHNDTRHFKVARKVSKSD